MKPSIRLRNFLLIAGSSLLVISSASAQSGTWDVDANGTWSTTTNWLSGTVADGSGSTANFTNNITDDRTVSLDGDRTLTSVVFGDSDTATAGSWILDNNGVSTNNLILAGTTPGITVNALGTDKTATISAIIEGTAGLVKSGTGTLILSGANTYTGTTTVNTGTLNLTGNRTVAMGTITVRTGGTLGISNGNFSIGDNTFTVGQSSGTSTVNHTGGTISTGTGGTQLLIGSLGDNSVGIYNLSGGNLNINVNNANRGIILGVNGGVNRSGIFNLSGSGILNMVSTSSLQIGRSDATASGTTTAFNQTGGTANVGILRMGGNTAGSSGVNSTLSLTGGVFTADSFDRLAYGDTNTALIEIGGTADVTLPAFPTVALGTDSIATITFDGGVLKNSAASTNYLGNISNAQIKNGGAKFNTDGGTITITHTLENFSGHTGKLTKEGANTLTLAGANTYSGSTTVSAGVLNLTNLAAIQNSSSVSVASGATLQANITGTYLNTAPVSLVGQGVKLANQEGALHFNSGGAISPVWNAPLTLGGSTRITSFGVTLNQTLGGAISGTGPLEISSRGGSSAVHVATWTLNAASNYSGNTAIVNNDGIKDITVKLGIDNALPTTTSLNLSATVGAGNTDVYATFDLNGYSQTLAGLTDTGGTANSGNTSNKRVINSSATLSTLTINNTGNITYGTTGTRITAGTIGGTTADGDPANNIALVKTGTGTLTLGGANTYTGATAIKNGTLALANGNNRLPTGTTVTLGDVVSNTSGVLRLNSRSQQLAGLLTAGTGTGNRVVNGNATSATLTLNIASGTNTFGGILGGTGTNENIFVLTKTGDGNLNLSSTNTYTGSTTVSAGTLYVTGALSNSAVTVESNGTVGSNGASGTLGNGLTIAAGGNLDLTGATLVANTSSLGILGLTGGNLTLGNLTFQDIVGWDWANAAPGTYELIAGTFGITWGSTAYLSPETAYVFGNGNKGYFTSGSLNAVIVAVPEPGAALLGGLGFLLLLRRRRRNA